MRVLFLTEWYPNKFDIQSGVFVRKHAKAASQFCEVNVLYVMRDSALKQSYVVEKSTSGSLSEWIVYYKGSDFKLFNAYINLSIHWKMIAAIRKEKGMEDIWHINIIGERTALLTMLQQWEKKIPYVITEHWTGYI